MVANTIKNYFIFTGIAYLIQLSSILVLYRVQIQIKLHVFIITCIIRNPHEF